MSYLLDIMKALDSPKYVFCIQFEEKIKMLLK